MTEITTHCRHCKFTTAGDAAEFVCPFCKRLMIIDTETASIFYHGPNGHVKPLPLVAGGKTVLTEAESLVDPWLNEDAVKDQVRKEKAMTLAQEKLATFLQKHPSLETYVAENTLIASMNYFEQNYQNKIDMNKPFYMNFAEDGGAPTMKFDDIEQAKNEATRLVLRLRKPVYTLKAVVKSNLPEEVVEVQTLGPVRKQKRRAVAKRRKKK